MTFGLLIINLLYVIFLPGFIWSYILLNNKKTSYFERIILSICFSIIILPIFMFFSNALGMKINALNIYYLNLGICLFGIIIMIIKYKKLIKLND
ncbi:MAG: hypothetical protein UR30_C0002G0147 [Candidatus Peregrinibacteria bacterium GW2011_GWC2_33_13]|nr:MAG: hypothetical protein UR30_C0002G0147 [Candidatus Peregrinibacteria bacterium GW2011_GWC2_33_13]